MMPTKTFAEFFAGIGLMRLGLEKAGWQIELANDIDPQKHEMYSANFADADQHFVLGDIHKLRGDEIPSVTLATASFPCTDLSLAGGRSGLGGAQSSAFWGFVSLLRQMETRKPPLIMLENVPGFLTSKGGKDFEAAMLALNELGYAVDAFIVDAVDFVPQSRQRLFVVGILKNGVLHNRKVAASLGFYESPLRPPVLSQFIFLHPEIDWKIKSLPNIRSERFALSQIIETVPNDSPEWWDESRTAYLLNQMSPRHRAIADTMIDGTKMSYGTVFRRVRNGRSMAELRVDGIAGCLRTPKGGSGRQILFAGGLGQARARLLNPRECARLMGAGDYLINVPQNQALFGFGDAVCVPVVTWIAENYLNPVLEELSLNQNMRANHYSPLSHPELIAA